MPHHRHRIRVHSPPPNPHAPAAQRERSNRCRLAEFIELRAIDLEVAELIVHEGRELVKRQAIVLRRVAQHGLRVGGCVRILVVLVHRHAEPEWPPRIEVGREAAERIDELVVQMEALIPRSVRYVRQMVALKVT